VIITVALWQEIKEIRVSSNGTIPKWLQPRDPRDLGPPRWLQQGSERPRIRVVYQPRVTARFIDQDLGTCDRCKLLGMMNKYGYGSIPINTILRGMNIQLYQLFWGSLGTMVLTHPHMKNIHIFHFSHVSPSGTEVTKPQCTISGFSGGRMLVDNQSLEVGPCLTVSARGRRDCGDCWNQTRMWVCLEMGYTLNYSHLIVNMMIKWLTMINQWVEGCTIFRHMKKLAKVNVWLLGSGTDFYKDFDCCRMGEASGCRKTCSRRVQTRGNRGDGSTVWVTCVTSHDSHWDRGPKIVMPGSSTHGTLW